MCEDCGTRAARWTGRCGGCGAWNSLREAVPSVPEVFPRGSGRSLSLAPALVGEGHGERAPDQQPVPTCIAEVDRVLAGGLVPGGLTLLGGEPGIGKSTLLAQMAAGAARMGQTAVVVSAEESLSQLRARAARLGLHQEHLWLAAEAELPRVLSVIGELCPQLVVVDSVQAVADPSVEAGPGSVSQVRSVARALARVAKEEGRSIVLASQVTKDGSLAGPRALEHLVDTVLSFEGDRHHSLRLLRATKHRFGATGELGVLEMTSAGLSEVPDAASLLLADRRVGVPGSVVVPALEGTRVLPVELQALVATTTLAQPRRVARGLDSGRLALVLAVLERRLGMSLVGLDVFASAVGGVRVGEPAADLGLAVALGSAATGVAVDEGVVVVGEVGLAGEVRRVAHSERRLGEAARWGAVRAIVPAGAPEPGAALATLTVRTLAEAFEALGLPRVTDRAELAHAGSQLS